MQISVVIPVYDRQVAAVRAIRSALAQAGPRVEIIVVDDASPRPFSLPPDLAADHRIRLLRNERNSGPSATRNAGIAAARGDWIALLDSDDYWLPDKIARQAEFVEADQKQNADTRVFYATGFRQINASDGRVLDRVPAPSADALDFASGCWFSPGSTFLFSKAAFEAAGGYDTRFRRLEDLDLALRLALAGGQLKVAPFIGTVIEVGARPSMKSIDATCRELEEKWRREPASSSPPGLMQRLQAYLDVERAAASRNDCLLYTSDAADE